jgi:hypothetical protein
MTMKTTTIALITLLSIAILFAACTGDSHKTTAVVGLWDRTDPGIPKPDASGIIQLYGFEKDKWNGGYFQFSAINAVSLNPSEQYEIGKANPYLSNEFKRSEELKQFQNNISEIIENAGHSKSEENNSSIYLPLVNALNSLAKNKADRKILLLYSDLMENTDKVSFYRKKDISLLIKEPKELMEELESMQALDDLSGIEVYFIYQPTNLKSDTLFQLVSNFYKTLLEKKGAGVFIKANLNS